MRRREFLSLVGGAATWPVIARAQQTPQRSRRVGILIGVFTEHDPEGQARVAAFLRTFRELGWDQQNVRIDIRWPAEDVTRVKADATELISFGPDAILVGGNVALAELQRQTQSIPTVFVQVSDP